MKSSASGDMVLIIGWYGTETAGDKAILYGVIDWVQQQYPNSAVVLSSLYPFLTRQTLWELDLEHITIVETYSGEFEAACQSCVSVIIGGGPLMDIEPLDHLLFAFNAASTRGIDRIVLGCGIGPLREIRYQKAVKRILELATYVGLRDTASAEVARKLSGISAEVLPDPAIAYVKYRSNLSRQFKEKTGRRAAFFLRSVPNQYLGIDGATADAVRDSITSTIVLFINQLLEEGWSIKLMPMHSFIIGDDDRIYNRALGRRIRGEMGKLGDNVYVESKAVSAAEIIDEMSVADIVVSMRYHSVFFASELGTNFVAIDYSSGGKIHGYLADCGKLNRMLTLTDVATTGTRRFRQILGMDSG